MQRASRALRLSAGFTIVELLIVIVVIAILAALVVVTFGNIRNKAYDSAVQNDLAHMRKKIELMKIDKGDYRSTHLVGMTLLRVRKDVYTVSPKTSFNLLYCNDPPAFTRYWIISQSKSGKIFYVSDEHGTREYPGTWDPASPGQATLCMALGAPAPGTSNYRGYAADDNTTGPWRPWVGGN